MAAHVQAYPVGQGAQPFGVGVEAGPANQHPQQAMMQNVAAVVRERAAKARQAMVQNVAAVVQARAVEARQDLQATMEEYERVKARMQATIAAQVQQIGALEARIVILAGEKLQIAEALNGEIRACRALIETLQQTIREREGLNQQLQNQLSSMTQERNQLRAENNNLMAANAQHAASLQHAGQVITTKQAGIDSLTAQLKHTQQVITNKQAEIQKLLAQKNNN